MKSNYKNINNDKKVVLLHKIIFRSMAVLCILLINATVIFAQTNTIPHGLWEVSQVTIEKSTNGKIEKKTYNKVSEMQSYLPCPQTWEIIDSKNVVLHYSEGMKETIEYTIEDGLFTVNMFGAILKYNYSTNNETLTLSTTHKYKWNKTDGLLDDIEEKWIITLKTQK